MAAVVQSTKASGTAVAGVTTPALTTTTGNLFVLDLGYYNNGAAGTTTAGDSKSNTYVDSVAEFTSTGASSGACFGRQMYKENGAGGASHTFTITLNAAQYPSICAKEISGALTSGAFDKSSTHENSGTTGLTSASTPTTAQADEILCGLGTFSDAGGTTTYTAQSAFTQDQNISMVAGSVIGLISASKVVSATGAYAFTFDVDNSSNEVLGAIGTFKATAVSQELPAPAPFVVF